MPKRHKLSAGELQELQALTTIQQKLQHRLTVFETKTAARRSMRHDTRLGPRMQALANRFASTLAERVKAAGSRHNAKGKLRLDLASGELVEE